MLISIWYKDYICVEKKNKIKSKKKEFQNKLGRRFFRFLDCSTVEPRQRLIRKVPYDRLTIATGARFDGALSSIMLTTTIIIIIGRYVLQPIPKKEKKNKHGICFFFFFFFFVFGRRWSFFIFFLCLAHSFTSWQ